MLTNRFTVVLQTMQFLKNATILTFLTLSAFIMYLAIYTRFIRLNDMRIGLHNLFKQKYSVEDWNAALTALPGDTTNRRRVRVLYWTAKLGNADWGYTSKLSKHCPHLSALCEFTANHSLFATSDALLFHMRSALNIPRNRRRPPNQKWIFAIRETPFHTHVNLKKIQGLFNTTMTFRVESDIKWTSGSYSKIPTGSQSQHNCSHNYADGKTKMTAWFVGNCATQSRREVYVRELQKHTEVHVYGNCGPYKCPRSRQEYCYHEVMEKNYKFYLSFENSLCADYITEKLWLALTVYVIPVVLGGGNYSAMLPPHSYIDVKDFASPKDLAIYLKKLDGNDTLYNEYFAWKNKYTAYQTRNTHPQFACSICRHVYDKQHVVERLVDVESFWSPAKHCTRPQSYYKGVLSQLGGQ